MGSGGGTTTPIATYVYGYDNANRVTTMVDAEGTYTYTYDNSNELTGVDKGGTLVESYGYDLNGNRDTTGYSHDGHERDRDVAGAGHLFLRQCREYDHGQERFVDHNVHL